jgi:hypothetical protein
MKRIGVSRRILVASPTLLAKEGEPTHQRSLASFPSSIRSSRVATSGILRRTTGTPVPWRSNIEILNLDCESKNARTHEAAEGLQNDVSPSHQRLRANDCEDLQDRRKPAIKLDEEPAIVVRKPGPAPRFTSQDDQLMSERRSLCLKPALRLEWRG